MVFFLITRRETVSQGTLGYGWPARLTWMIPPLPLLDTTAGVFHLRSPLGQYKLTFDKAREACASEAATIATYNQLSYAQKVGPQRAHTVQAGSAGEDERPSLSTGGQAVSFTQAVQGTPEATLIGHVPWVAPVGQALWVLSCRYCPSFLTSGGRCHCCHFTGRAPKGLEG